MSTSKLVDWDSYLAMQPTEERVREFWSRYRSAFKDQYVNLRNYYSSELHRTIVSLGAGTMVDIPIQEFMLGGSDVTLVDWADGLSEKAYTILKNDEQDSEFGRCSRQPRFITSDVTGGVSSHFVENILSVVIDSPDPHTACRSAVELAKAGVALKKPLPLEDYSQDVVISSMVVSQMYIDPWMFFRKNLRKRFGITGETTTAELATQLQHLRMLLYQVQVDGHIAELYRLVKKESGRVYFSMEFFRSDEDFSNYHYFAPGNYALFSLSKYFTFRLDEMPLERLVSKAQLPYGPAMIFAYLLNPREL